jgi:drug/metabolite transporter (DMT)-like permease
MKNKKILAVGGLLLMSIIWGSNIPYMKIALDFSGPAEFAFLRNFFGAMVLFLILLILGKPILIKEASKLFILGLFQTAGFTGFIIMGISGRWGK